MSAKIRSPHSWMDASIERDADGEGVGGDVGEASVEGEFLMA